MIWLSLDTLRSDFAKQLMPSLERLRRDGLDFENAYSTHGGTHFSLSSIMSSRLLPARRAFEGHDTLASLLHEKGFLTVAMVAAELAVKDPIDSPTYLKGFERIHYDTSPAAIGRMSALLRRQERPVFFWIHDLGAHMPSFSAASARAFTIEWRVAEYRRRMKLADSWLSTVLDLLAKDGWDVDSATALFSDHGELMGEQGLFFHAKPPYQPLARIPIIWRYPTSTAASRGEQTSALDLAPTALEALGQPSSPTFQGRARLDNRRSSVAITLNSSDLWCPDRAVEYAIIEPSGQWKLMHSLRHNYIELYNLRKDPAETNDLSNELPSKVLELQRLYESFTNDGWPAQQKCGPL